MRSFNSIIPSTTLTLLYFFSLSLLYLSTHLQAYDPVDHFTINCGTTGNSTDGERTWTGDTNSKLLSPPQNNPTTVSATATTQSPSVNKIPFSTARLSHAQFNYSFPVTPGPKFLRLFFYPAAYPGFNSNNACFTIKSNGFTLLKDFNASLNAEAEGRETIFKEYIINIDDDQRLDLSITPSSNSYAFINGIEVLSMPSDLYYTSSDNQEQPMLVGGNTVYPISTSYALETGYRIKVGGQTITPSNDTNLFRTWEGNDEDFLRTPSALDSLPGDTTGSMNITVKPDYVAPQQLYRTARDLGTNGALNKKLNLTWEFPLDSGFYYMLRLHFCELYPNINNIGDRVFFIYVAGQAAETRADVMSWSGNQRGVAVHRDYAVLINGNHKRVNFSVQMHPYGDSGTLYSDPFLNGLEIFKISDVGSNHLAGPNPDPVQTPQNPQVEQESSSGTSKIEIVVGVVDGVVLLAVVVFFFIFIVVRKKRRTETKTKGKDSKPSATSKWGPLSFSTTKSTNTHNSSLPSDLCRHFSLVVIKAATNNFDEVFIVGVGGFGHVYKGYLDGGSIPVAIKRLKPGSRQGEHEFINEIDMLSKLRHLHLVSLIGYCYENNEMILVYDFMTRGTLRDHLYDTDNPPLSWKQRLQICIGVARGLHYLHTGAKHTIIHRDVKTTNILLDEKWVAKVSDFGLSRIGPTGLSKAHVTTGVKGSIGYLDPEIYKRQRLSVKSDVYSFGVVMFEILCARPPLVHSVEKRQVSLADWASDCFQSGTLDQIVDPTLKGRIAPECLKKFGEIGMRCLLDDATQRPSMNDVVWTLEFALQLQESAEQREDVNMGVVDEMEGEERDGSDDIFSRVISVTSSSRDNSYGNKKIDASMSGTVFSEMMHHFLRDVDDAPNGTLREIKRCV